MSAPIVEYDFTIDLGAPTELKAGPCDLIVRYGLDHIQLIKHDEVLARISRANSLYSILMDAPMPLSHARNRIAEITWSCSMKTVYAPNLTFSLFGEDCVDNDFLVQ